MSYHFSSGTTIATSMRLWSQNFVPFTFISLFFHVPLIVWTVYVARSSDPAVIEPWEIWSDAASLVTQQLVMGAVVFAVYEMLRGQSPTSLQCIGHGIVKLLPVLGVTLVTTVLVFLGLFTLLIPGLIIYTMVWVALPVVINERVSIFRSIARSGELTRGYRWHVFGVIVLSLVLTFVPALILALVMFPENMTPEEVDEAWPKYMAIHLVLQVFLTSLVSVFPAVGYYELRKAKEGLDLRELADVFD